MARCIAKAYLEPASGPHRFRCRRQRFHFRTYSRVKVPFSNLFPSKGSNFEPIAVCLLHSCCVGALCSSCRSEKRLFKKASWPIHIEGKEFTSDSPYRNAANVRRIDASLAIARCPVAMMPALSKLSPSLPTSLATLSHNSCRLSKYDPSPGRSLFHDRSCRRYRRILFPSRSCVASGPVILTMSDQFST